MRAWTGYVPVFGFVNFRRGFLAPLDCQPWKARLAYSCTQVTSIHTSRYRSTEGFDRGRERNTWISIGVAKDTQTKKNEGARDCGACARAALRRVVFVQRRRRQKHVRHPHLDLSFLQRHRGRGDLGHGEVVSRGGAPGDAAQVDLLI